VSPVSTNNGTCLVPQCVSQSLLTARNNTISRTFSSTSSLVKSDVGVPRRLQCDGDAVVPADVNVQPTPRRVPQTPKPALRPLVLHFDINKTIVMSDSVTGTSADNMVNALLSEVCWGTWDATCARGTLEEKIQCAATWQLDSGPSVVGPRGMINYTDLLEVELKLPKKERSKLKHAFADPGSPGEGVSNVRDRLKKALAQPAGFFLLPSFYALVLRLHEEGRDFRLIFRTFGVDLPSVILEFNTFCAGGHPAFPHTPDGLRARAVQMPVDTGEWYRDSEGLHLALCCAHDGGAELVTVAHGDTECAKSLNDKLFGKRPSLTLALRDYHEFWKKSGEADNAGKPLLVHQNYGPNTPHTMFFDDNIEKDRSHIVDARCAETGLPLPFEETQGIQLIRSEPIHAIEDPDYFIKLVSNAEAALATRIADLSS